MKQCKFETCDRNATALGWCPGHYAQYRRGVELTPLKKYIKTKGDKKECTGCKKVLPLDAFAVRKQTGTPQSRCRACTNEQTKAWYRRMRSKAAAYEAQQAETNSKEEL